jgi:hypothetical protein
MPTTETRTLRIAHVTNGRDAKQVWAFLPGNYAIISGIDGEYLIAGYDNAGWTMDDYVIPRMASGLIWVKEVTDDPEFIMDFLHKQRL